MTNEQAVEWARRAKSTCNTSIDGDAATLLHWTDNDPAVAQAIADLRIAVGSSIDHKARQAYMQTIEDDQPMRYGIISRKDAVIVKGAQMSAQSVAMLQAEATQRLSRAAGLLKVEGLKDPKSITGGIEGIHE
jgi:hypothetical protein